MTYQSIVKTMAKLSVLLEKFKADNAHILSNYDPMKAEPQERLVLRFYEGCIMGIVFRDNIELAKSAPMLFVKNVQMMLQAQEHIQFTLHGIVTTGAAQKLRDDFKKIVYEM